MSDDAQGMTEDALAMAKEAIAGDVPLMSQPPDGKVALFRGLWHQGTWRTDAVVRELTGEDEEAVARAMSGNDTIGFVNAMLQQGTESIGSVDFSTLAPVQRVEMLNQLLIGEKDLLFLRILQTTFGDERTVVTTCPSCQKDMDVILTVSGDVKIRDLEDPHRTAYEFKMRDGTILEYRLVTGGDQAEATKRKGASVAEQNTIMLSQCITSVNGKIPVDPLRTARSMGAADRRKLLAEISDLQPGPYFEGVKLPCPECGVEATFQPGWADLL